MGHGGRGECGVVLVAVVTRHRRRHVVRRLAERIGPIMAVGACSGHDACMIEGSRCPGGRRAMTGTALQAGRNMRRWLDLRILCNVGTAVTGRTTGQASVVHPGWRPSGIPQGVTGIALTGDRNVRRRFG